MGLKVYNKEYEIHYYEIDFKKRLLLTSLLDFLGDIAIHHTNELNVGMEFLKDKGLAWVLYSWDISIDRFPMLGEKITVKTTPESLKKFYALRKYEVMDESGTVIARADSIWFLINVERRRPVRIIEEFYKAFDIDVNAPENIEIQKQEKLSTIDAEKTFHVRYSDIDTNNHVNNVKYVGWAMETVPLDIVLNYTLKSLKVNYEKETGYGQTIKAAIEIRQEGNNVVCLHKVLDSEGNELTLLNTVWKRN